MHRVRCSWCGRIFQGATEDEAYLRYTQHLGKDGRCPRQPDESLLVSTFRGRLRRMIAAWGGQVQKNGG